MARRRRVEAPPCPNEAEHTNGPTGYCEWDLWAEHMSLSHFQIPCTGCGLYKVWIPKFVAAIRWWDVAAENDKRLAEATGVPAVDLVLRARTGTQVGEQGDEVLQGEIVSNPSSGVQWFFHQDDRKMVSTFTVKWTDEWLARGDSMQIRAIDYYVEEIKKAIRGEGL
jgi:hypothetical protein